MYNLQASKSTYTMITLTHSYPPFYSFIWEFEVEWVHLSFWNQIRASFFTFNDCNEFISVFFRMQIAYKQWNCCPTADLWIDMWCKSKMEWKKMNIQTFRCMYWQSESNTMNFNKGILYFQILQKKKCCELQFQSLFQLWFVLCWQYMCIQG